jgi:hypothetical protein
MVYIRNSAITYLGDTTNLVIIAGALVVVDVLLFFVSTAAFHREEILTKWK